MSFGENLTNLRRQKGWSQDDLANNLDLSRQAISKWENETSKPDIDNIKKISKIFSIKIDDLINNELPDDKAVTLDVKKEEKREKTITIIKLMIIAVIILYVISVIYKFASLLVIVNGVQKYANLNNYHYVITTYDENGLAEKEECWFKDGVCKKIITNQIESEQEYIKTTYFIDFLNNYGIIENDGKIIQINVENYLKDHFALFKENELFSAIPIEIRKNDVFFLFNSSLKLLVSGNNKEITLKLGNKIIELDKNTMLPLYVYDYNIDGKNYAVKYYKIELNKVENIEE